MPLHLLPAAAFWTVHMRAYMPHHQTLGLGIDHLLLSTCNHGVQGEQVKSYTLPIVCFAQHAGHQRKQPTLSWLGEPLQRSYAWLYGAEVIIPQFSLFHLTDSMC